MKYKVLFVLLVGSLGGSIFHLTTENKRLKEELQIVIGINQFQKEQTNVLVKKIKKYLRKTGEVR